MKKIMIALLAAGLIMQTPAFAAGLTGGWEATVETAIPQEAQEAFDTAMEGLLGVDYEAVDLLATQVVAGMNYCFLCRTKVVAPDAAPDYAFVYIYRDLKGGAEILGIQDIAFGEGILEEDAAEEAAEETESAG